jgi:hypothetical protein
MSFMFHECVALPISLEAATRSAHRVTVDVEELGTEVAAAPAVVIAPGADRRRA